MPGAAVDVGTGTTITAGTSGWMAQVESVRWTGITRNAIETSHMGTPAPSANRIGNRTYIGGDLVDPGQLTLSVHFNPNTNPPMHGVTETWTVSWPLVTGDSTAASWAASGFMTSFEITDPLDDKMLADVVIKLTSNIVFTDAT